MQRLITILISVIILCTGCSAGNQKIEENKLHNAIYTIHYNNLVFEFNNFNSNMEILSSVAEQQISFTNLLCLSTSTKMLAHTNNFFILASIKKDNQMPEQIKKKIVDPRIMPYLDYIFETQDALRKMDKYFSMFLATSKGSLPDSEIKTFGKLKQDIVLLKSIYSNLGTDFLKGDDIDIKTLKQLHEINQEIIKITSL